MISVGYKLCTLLAGGSAATHQREPRRGAEMPVRLGLPELSILLLVVLLLFRASRLPQVGAALGKGIRDFRSVFDEPPEEEERKTE